MTHSDQSLTASKTRKSRYRGFATNSGWQSARAGKLRGQLFELLGPRCAECDCDLHGIAWQVNHIYKREWEPRRFSFYKRQLRYLAEAQAGEVNAMCPTCNATYRALPRSAKPANPTPSPARVFTPVHPMFRVGDFSMNSATSWDATT